VRTSAACCRRTRTTCAAGRQYESLEGHADARGTNEYNLALGERRGNAVKDYLVSLGIAVDRLTVISKGEEAQVCAEMTDECYGRNRRVHSIITAK
jgi:peptidoglycan-associated lipoprotein